MSNQGYTLLQGLILMTLMAALVLLTAGDAVAQETSPGAPMPSTTLRLSLDQAVALFLRQNLDLLMAQYGIDSAKGQQITARLLPNPVLNMWAYSSLTQGNTVIRSTEVGANVQQLFELANKRGYRIESAQFGTQAAEANFADTLRQLTFTVKDAYFRVGEAEERLVLANQNLERFKKILEVNTIRFNKGYIAEVDLVRIRLQTIDFQSDVIQALQERAAALTDLRTVLSLPPSTKLELVTDLEYHRVDLDLDVLHRLALGIRPDLRMKQLTVSQSRADWKLARAYRYPDPSLGPGVSIQGPTGPDLQQMYFFTLSIPLMVFNRNQGGIVQAEVGIHTAEADLRKTLLQVDNDVEVAYLALIENRRLVEVYRAGVVKDARESVAIIEGAFQRGGATILDLLDAARTAAAIQRNYIDVLYGYQRNLFQLESAVGKELPP